MDDYDQFKSMLINMAKRDRTITTSGKAEELNSMYIKNTKFLKTFLIKYGWPDSMTDSCLHDCAWLIAQHSNNDPGFQIQCLGLILPEIKNNKETLIDCTFLLDRILVNLKKDQIFGTQLCGELKKPITFSPTQFDSLRDKIGLEHFNAYLSRMYDYAKTNDLRYEK
ncbi:hypothetical protein HQ531_06030 [bacterium]|nr:hypothetical protein [bacterium]